jgi:hypothetical protein
VRFTLALIGLRSQDLRGYVRNPRPASPGSTTKVEACHPLWTRQCQHFGAYTDSARGPYLDMEMPPWALAVAESHPRGPTGRVGAGHNARASPEMRPGSHHDDWAATPQAALSHLVRRRLVVAWLLHVTKIQVRIAP